MNTKNIDTQEYLLRYGVRPSLQRMAIVEYLMTHKTHPTAEEIFSALHPSVPTLSRTTVYNTVSMLAGRGAILALTLDTEQMHFDGDTSPHAHFICTSCRSISDIEPDAAGWGGVLAAAAPPTGSVVSDVQLSYRGICSKCNTLIHNN